MCINLWIVLTSTSGLRKTSNKGRERLRLSLRIGEILGPTNTIIASPKGILLDNLGLQLLRWLTRYSESQYIKSWKRSRISHTSNGQTKWEEIPWDTTKVFIANTIRSEGIPSRIVELYGTIWSNWLEMEGYNNFCIGPTDKETNQGQGLTGTLLQGPC